ncbi:phage tail protein [Marinobacterium stanieri]|uniref:phage tail protein n=1 Tax=Marinobacterium stanieri TaxID=49186 RepID=UPI000594E0D8|nr:tail fiber protein [Marinobacterium stanieri]
MSFSLALIGEIRALPYLTGLTPPDWIPCDGRPLGIAQYSALFAVIGTRFGGDGVSTFKVPDLRGRVPVGCGFGPNQTPPMVGDKFGTESEAIGYAEMAQHNHQVTVAQFPAQSSQPSEGYLAVNNEAVYASPKKQPLLKLSPGALATSGEGQSHDNMSPSLALRFCIASTGLYPTPG